MTEDTQKANINIEAVQFEDKSYGVTVMVSNLSSEQSALFIAERLYKHFEAIEKNGKAD